VRAHTVNSGRELSFLAGYPTELIVRLEPGLIVDVGAATGDKTLLMRRASPASRVIAYEPFPGNLPHLENSLRGDSMVTLRPTAVSDYQGTGKLFLPSIIGQHDKRWSGLAGSSRVGKLNPAPFRKAVAKVDVPVIMLDREIHEHVRFLKIDIQVGEYHVLNGARGLIERHGVDLIYVEFRGDLRLLRLLDDAGYVTVDGAYMVWPHWRYFRNFFQARTDWKVPDWDVLAAFTLSNGHRARRVWPRVPCRSFAGYCLWFYFERVFVTGMQTDLLCIHKSFLAEFDRLCKAAHSEEDEGEHGRGKPAEHQDSAQQKQYPG
jgi:FkbM family methyltransferase